MLMALFIIVGLISGFFIGYTYAYSEVIDKAFSSKANNEPFEITSGDKKAVMIVKHIEADK